MATINKKLFSHLNVEDDDPVWEKVKRIKVLSGERAQKLYGKAGEHGVIVIESKK